jgi:hypothetical protein
MIIREKISFRIKEKFTCCSKTKGVKAFNHSELALLNLLLDSILHWLFKFLNMIRLVEAENFACGKGSYDLG